MIGNIKSLKLSRLLPRIPPRPCSMVKAPQPLDFKKHCFPLSKHDPQERSSCNVAHDPLFAVLFALEACITVKPTILLAATSRWFPSARLASALASAGCKIEAVCPRRHPLGKTSGVQRIHTY